MQRTIVPKFMMLDGNGDPLSGGKVWTYEAGTSTPKATYQDYALTTANANPIILDARGECVIFCTGALKLVVHDSDDVEIWTWDNLQPTELGELVDVDGDTKVEVERTTDDDIIRFRVAGTDIATIDAQGITPAVSYGLVDADGDTKIVVEESTDEDKIHFHTGADGKQITLEDGVLFPDADDDVDLGKTDKAWKDAYVDGKIYVSLISEKETDEKIGFEHEIQVDVIEEKTNDTGVTIDGVLIKDGLIAQADSVDQNSIAANVVGRSELKEASGEVNTTGDTNLTLPGGQYGFYPRTKGSSGSEVYMQIWSDHTGTSYATIIYMQTVVGTGYAEMTYITASGEVNWIFALRDKATKARIAHYKAPDHPCFGNGGDPDLVPHPFGDFDSALFEVVVINPTDAEWETLHQEAVATGRSPLEVFTDDYEIDDVGPQARWPTRQVTVDLERDSKGQKTGRVVKRTISKPPGFKCYSLRKK